MRHLLLATTLILTIPAIANAQPIGRGQYLVERVGMCNDCHTPRDATGKLIMSNALQGASIGSKPIHPMPWAEIAPPIAGLPSHYTPEQRVTFLRTGKRPDGSTPRPPMPPYQWSHGDAVAVTAWLRYMKQ
jgi:hypothetical protein